MLRQHLTDGFSLNQRRLHERGVALGEVLALLSHTLVKQQLVSQQGEDVLRVISDYARTWSLLQRAMTNSACPRKRWRSTACARCQCMWRWPRLTN